MLQVCFLNVLAVSSRCCIFSSGCCICCGGYTRMLQVYSKCFTCFTRMLQAFYLDVAYAAVVIHICYKRMFQALFACLISRTFLANEQYFSLTTNQRTVLSAKRTGHVVTPCFSMLQQVLLPRALTHGQARAAPGVLAPSGVVSYGGACSWLLPSSLSRSTRAMLSLVLGYAHRDPPLSRYGLSCIGASALCFLSVSYNCAPSHIRVRAMCSLSHMQLTKQKET
jgi:hypothetical protein